MDDPVNFRDNFRSMLREQRSGLISAINRKEIACTRMAQELEDDRATLAEMDRVLGAKSSNAPTQKTIPEVKAPYNPARRLTANSARIQAGNSMRDGLRSLARGAGSEGISTDDVMVTLQAVWNVEDWGELTPQRLKLTANYMSDVIFADDRFYPAPDKKE